MHENDGVMEKKAFYVDKASLEMARTEKILELAMELKFWKLTVMTTWRIVLVRI